MIILALQHTPLPHTSPFSTPIITILLLPHAASRILQVLDHVGIYLLIAGTYTPFLLIGLHHHAQVSIPALLYSTLILYSTVLYRP